jgi:polysaccharide export outer membrane protein
MKKNSLTLNFLYIIIAFSCIGFNSCTSAKNVIYFQNLQKDVTVPTIVNGNFEVKIRRNDLININIISPDPITTPLFNGIQNTSTSLVSPSGSTVNPGGFLVDDNGNISLYKLGTIHVEGLTRNELKNLLEKELIPYLKDPVVNIRFLNNHVTVLGEVSKPQVLPMPTEKFSLLEALGTAGDITFTGRKDNVLIIRETPSGKQLKRINLADSSIFNSPYYYLKPDDIVYVEPTKVKIKNGGNAPQTIGYLLTAISIAFTLILNLLR